MQPTPVYFYSATFVANGQNQHSHGSFSYGGDPMRITTAIEKMIAESEYKVNRHAIAIHSVSRIS